MPSQEVKLYPLVFTSAVFLHLSGTHIYHNADHADIFDGALLNFSSLILSSMTMITLYTFWNRFFQKRHGFSDGRVVSKTKLNIFCSTFSVYLYKVFEVNISRLININFLRLLLFWNLHGDEGYCNV